MIIGHRKTSTRSVPDLLLYDMRETLPALDEKLYNVQMRNLTSFRWNAARLPRRGCEETVAISESAVGV
jgi:hypothetical protein